MSLDLRAGDRHVHRSHQLLQLCYSSERVICEYSAEAVRGLYITSHNTLYAVIGDRHGLALSDVTTDDYEPRVIPFERQHSVADCPSQQTLLNREVVCIVPVDTTDSTLQLPIEKEIYTMNLETMGLLTSPHPPLRPSSVVFDFDGRRVLWLEQTNKGTKTLKVTSVVSRKEVAVAEVRYGRRVTSAKLMGNQVVFVRDFRHMYAVEIEEGSEREELGVAECDIFAIDVFLAKEQLVVPVPNPSRIVPVAPDTRDIVSRLDSTSLVLLTLDAAGKVSCWNSQHSELICDLLRLPELRKPLHATELFSMGYRYLIAGGRAEVAVSTDVGVFLLYSEKFGRLIQS